MSMCGEIENLQRQIYKLEDELAKLNKILWEYKKNV
jgi:hypothetical protein